MTVLGFQVISPDRAFAWCDSEVFSGTEGIPTGHALKVAVNALGVFIVAGSGRLGPFRDAADAVVMCQTFDEAIARLPCAMRLACRAYASEEVSARAPLRGQTIAAVGFSHSRRAIVGATFDLQNDFEPVVPRRRFLSPPIDGARVADPHSAISVAQWQLAVLRREFAAATGGALILAEITPAGINCGPIFDFTTGRLLRRAPDLSDRAAAARGREMRPDQSASAAKPRRPVVAFAPAARLATFSSVTG